MARAVILQPTTEVHFVANDSRVRHEVLVMRRAIGFAVENDVRRWAFQSGIGPITITGMERRDLGNLAVCPCCGRDIEQGDR